MVKLYKCWKRIKGGTKQNKKWKDVMRKQREAKEGSEKVK